MKNLLALAALITGLVVVPSAARAQDIIDLDDDDSRRSSKRSKKNKKASKTERAAAEAEVVREVEKGWYVKSNVGGAFYLLDFSGGILQPGTMLGLTIGNDFVDNEAVSMAYELNVASSIHNGMPWYTQQDIGVPITRAVQGDSRTLGATLGYEISFYPARRFGVGFHLGAGVQYSPLAITEEEWLDIIGGWGGDPKVHNTPHFLAYGGPTFEYYTKLSHFSVGADVDVTYALGWDLGMAVSGFMKYTF